MCSDSDSYTAGLCVRPGGPAHLLYGAKFLHLPLYRGDGDSAVEGLLSTQNEQEEVAKEKKEEKEKRKWSRTECKKRKEMEPELREVSENKELERRKENK